MRVQEEAVIWIDGLNEEWNLPEMILHMIGADGKHRRIPLDDSACSIQRVQFSALDVDLYISRLHPGKNFVESDAVHDHVTLTDRGGFVSITGERDRSGLCSHGRALQRYGFAFRTQ